MGTTKEEIRGWLLEAKRTGATHVLVVCDTFSYEDYPVSVMPGEDPRKKAREYDNKNMQRLMEVYSMGIDIDVQLAEHRSFHYEMGPKVMVAAVEMVVENKPKLRHPSESAQIDPLQVTDPRELLELLKKATRRVWTEPPTPLALDFLCEEIRMEAALAPGSVTAKELPKYVKEAQEMLRKEWKTR